jgi:hypothetical protein
LQAGTKIFKEENQTQTYGFLLIIKHKKARISQKRWDFNYTKKRCSRIVKGTKRHLLSHKKARISQMIKSQLSKIKQHILKNILSEKQKMPKKE